MWSNVFFCFFLACFILLSRAQEVEELICWHEDFDSREYTRNSQRHAATLEHGQREIRSIVGSVLLAQLRTNYHNHLAQVKHAAGERHDFFPFVVTFYLR